MADETYKRKAYEVKEGSNVANALKDLNTHLGSNPGQYSSTWQGQLGTLYNDIVNRKDFSYDFNADALYQQYKDKYTQQAKMAMQDTMGQAAAMTGGYGNSYAATVGNQAYQSTMQNLNDIIPELYQMAYDKYTQEGQDLYNQYGLVSDMESKDYRNHRAKVDDWMANREYYTGRYNSELAFDYGQHVDAENWAYEENRAAIEDGHWLSEFNEAVRQFTENFNFNKSRAEKEDEHWREEMDLKKNNAKIDYSDDLGDDLSDELYDESLYSDWDAGDWESYFANIRQSEGKSAAEKELETLTKKGLIPKNYVAMAAIGARGSGGGH